MARHAGLVFWMTVIAVGVGCSRNVDEMIQRAETRSDAETRSPDDGHHRMIAAMTRVAERSDRENPYLGRAALDELQREWDAKAPGLSVAERVSLLAALGFHKLRVGEIDAALAELDRANELRLQQPDLVPQELHATLLLMLSVAWFRVGETENCVFCQDGQSCIFPFEGASLHQRRTGSEQAKVHLLELLALKPDDLAARWLVNLAAMTLGEHPQGLPESLGIPADPWPADDDVPRFVNRAPELGLDVMSLSGGMIADDFNGDDLLDIVMSDCRPAAQLRLFQNQGDGTFRETTEAAGLTGITGGLNLLQADYDNDGALDILVLRGAWLTGLGDQPNSLLRNDGRGRFRDVTFDVGLGDVHRPTQTAAWGDFDLDGDLDLFIGNESQPCQLFLNDGTGKFTDVARSAGVENGRFTKGVVAGDYDGDGQLDLYVSNLGSPNRLYRNLGNLRFADVAPELGVERPIAGFPAFFWDLNNDGRLDISAFSYNADIADIAADYLGLPVRCEPDAHYLGDGAGGFVNRTAELRLDRVTHPMGANFGDFDHDGYLDFYLGTGDIPFQMLMPNLAFRNDGGRFFSDITKPSGLGHLQKGHGIAFADLDQDGDQDLAVELGGAFAADLFRNALFENTTPSEKRNHWIGLHLVGTTSNRSAIGAHLHLRIREDGTERSLHRWINSGGSFGANPLRQQIGIGRAAEVLSLEIDWPGGRTPQRFEHLPADQFLRLREGSTEIEVLPWRPTPFGRGNQRE